MVKGGGGKGRKKRPYLSFNVKFQTSVVLHIYGMTWRTDVITSVFKKSCQVPLRLYNPPSSQNHYHPLHLISITI